MEPNSIEKIVEIDTHIGKKTEWVLAVSDTEKLQSQQLPMGLKWQWVSLAVLIFLFLRVYWWMQNVKCKTEQLSTGYSFDLFLRSLWAQFKFKSCRFYCDVEQQVVVWYSFIFTIFFTFLQGCAMSGLIADAKTLIDKARVETQVQIRCAVMLRVTRFSFCTRATCLCVLAQNHWFTYNETMTVESVTQAVSNLALQFGEEDADPGAMVSHFLPSQIQHTQNPTHR